MLMAQEAIASTEIELGPFDKDEKEAMFIHLISNGEITLKDARIIVEWIKENV
jgi:hypothetical protein